MSDEIATLFAQKFIARRDVKAIQHADGSWSPHTVTGKRDGERIKWRMSDIRDHLAGNRTYGHYLLDQDSKCKLFAFDIDFEKNDSRFTGTYIDGENQVVSFDAREAWRDRRHPSREQMKIALMLTAYSLGDIIRNDLQLPCAVAYSGNKGLHVYAFTGLIDAADAREGADMVMDIFGEMEPTRGENFYRAKDQDFRNSLRNLSIEVFPKQGTLEGKDLGNLMRLPLGVNLKNTKDPTFFVDMTQGSTVMKPVDAVAALTTDAAWRKDA